MTDYKQLSWPPETHDLVSRKNVTPISSIRSFGKNPYDFTEMEEGFKIAKFFSEMTEICPREIQKKPYEVLGRILYGRSVGLNPMESLKSIYFVNGKPCVYGDSLAGICRRSSTFEQMVEMLEEETLIRFQGQFISLKERDDLIALALSQDNPIPVFENIKNLVASCTVYRVNEEPHTRTFSQLDAMTANLWGKAGPWKLYPKRMLQMRARSWALRDKFPDLLSGIIAWEEAIDITPINVKTTNIGDTAEIVLNKLTRSENESELEYQDDEEALKEECVNSDTYFKIMRLIKDQGISDLTQQQWLKKFNVDSLEDISEVDAHKILRHYNGK